MCFVGLHKENKIIIVIVLKSISHCWHLLAPLQIAKLSRGGEGVRALPLWVCVPSCRCSSHCSGSACPCYCLYFSMLKCQFVGSPVPRLRSSRPISFQIGGKTKLLVSAPTILKKVLNVPFTECQNRVQCSARQVSLFKLLAFELSARQPYTIFTRSQGASI